MTTQPYCAVRQMQQLIFNCTVVDFLSEFFFSDFAERVSSEPVSGWFWTKNCVSYEINIADFLSEILSKVLGTLNIFRPDVYKGVFIFYFFIFFFCKRRVRRNGRQLLHSDGAKI